MDNTPDPAGVAVFIAVVAGVLAVSFSRPDQWGLRRIGLGVCVVGATSAALMLVPSGWWWGGLLWGAHQIYLGWSFVSRRQRTTHERVQYLETSAAVLAYVALADGDVDPRETTVIRETYARAGFSLEDIHHVERVVQECRRRFFADGSDPDRLFVRLRDACAIVVRHSNAQTRFGFLRAAIMIAAVDGFVSAAEARALRATAEWLGIGSDDYGRLWRSVLGREASNEPSDRGGDADDSSGRRETGEPVVPPDLATYYASILGVPLTASPQELKRAYREKAKQYHPDVVAHKGQDFAREAEARFKELSQAYHFFRGARVA